MKRTRVLINSIHAKSGGGVTYITNILPHLCRIEDLDIHVVIQEDQKYLVESLCPNTALHVLPTWSRMSTVTVQEQVVVPWLAMKIGADVIYSPANFGPLLSRHSVILLRNAFGVAALESDFSKKLYWQAVFWLSQASFAVCKRAITVSGYAKQMFLESFQRKDDDRISIIHHGVGPHFSPPASIEQREPLTLLAVGDIYIQKNYPALIEALQFLRHSFPAIKLFIAGAPLDTGHMAGLQEQIEIWGLEKNVQFLGRCSPDKLAELYRKCTVFVFPSTVETFGNPVVEAMASGCAIACSDAAAMPELVADAALLFNPDDPEDIAIKVESLLVDAELRRDMTARALERAQQFSWEKTAQQTAALLRQVV
jgi:glycosyltransferase involved in cell wall biosynthesis